MRIAQISTLYPPEFFAGGTIAPHRLAVSLRARGHDVRVFAGSCVFGEPALSEKRWEFEGVPVHAVNVMAGYAHGTANYRNASVAHRFAHWLEEAHPDVVHFHCIQALGADMLAVPRRLGIASVLTMHDGWFLCARGCVYTGPALNRNCPLTVDPSACDCLAGFEFVERRRFLDRALEHVDRVLAVSAPFAAVLAANGIAPGKLLVCENGMPAASRGAAEPRSSKLQLAFLGGPDASKGARTIAGALERLAGDRALELRLHGIEPERWRELGGRVDDPRVRLLPRFTPDRLPSVLAGVDAVLVPSLGMESFSIVTREALQLGIPVLASRCVGPEGVVTPEANGLLFERGDASGLAALLERLLDEQGLLSRLKSGAAATRIRSVEEQVSEVEDLYRELAHSAPLASAPVSPALPRSVLLIGGMDGAPFRYRVADVVEQLEALGVSATARLQYDEEVLALAGEHEWVVLNRVAWDPWTQLIVERARAAGALLVFGIDDLVFDLGLEIPALRGVPRELRRGYAKGQRRFRRTLLACDAFLGSTQSLVEAARVVGKPAFLHPNTLGRELLGICAAAYADGEAARARRLTKGLRAGYFSGSQAHDRDFEVSAPALAQLLRERDDFHLVIGGHLRLPQALAPFEQRIERLPFVSWRALPGLLAGVDVNLAPLETPSRFNDAKSALKWFEAAAVGVPTVASPTAEYVSVIRDGENGFIAREAGDWLRALRAYLSDEALRRRHAEAARLDTLASHTFEAAIPKLRATLEAMSAVPRRASSPPPPGGASELARVRAMGLGIGRPALEPRDLAPGPCHLDHGPTTPPIAGSSRACQPVTVPDGWLVRVDLLVGTFGRLHRHDLELNVLDLASGETLGHSVVPAEDACDNAWLAFDVTPIRTSGRELLLCLDAPAAPSAGGLGIYCSVPGWPSGAGWCGDAKGLILCHRTWMLPAAQVPGERETAEALERRIGQLERRLRIGLERLARVDETTRLSSLLARGPAAKAARLLRGPKLLGPAPSLPYRLVQQALRAVTPEGDEARLADRIEQVRSTAAYRAARSVYRKLRRR